jgi:hypothetical protein
VTPPANPEIVNGLARIDLDQDGRADVFSTWATTEGINRRLDRKGVRGNCGANFPSG